MSCWEEDLVSSKDGARVLPQPDAMAMVNATHARVSATFSRLVPVEFPIAQDVRVTVSVEGISMWVDPEGFWPRVALDVVPPSDPTLKLPDRLRQIASEGLVYYPMLQRVMLREPFTQAHTVYTPLRDSFIDLFAERMATSLQRLDRVAANHG